MGLLKEKGERPAFKGDGVAVWINKDKNGKEYLSIKILNSFSVAAFDNSEPKEKEKDQVNQ